MRRRFTVQGPATRGVRVAIQALTRWRRARTGLTREFLTGAAKDGDGLRGIGDRAAGGGSAVSLRDTQKRSRRGRCARPAVPAASPARKPLSGADGRFGPSPLGGLPIAALAGHGSSHGASKGLW
ncbi:MAG: hypothetical protein NVS9B10_03940 [Nevskia sp.]